MEKLINRITFKKTVPWPGLLFYERRTGRDNFSEIIPGAPYNVTN
jgi:hypothetical protein